MVAWRPGRSDILPCISPFNKWRKTASEGSGSEEDQRRTFVDLHGRSSGSAKLVEMSKEAATFIEAAFKTKVKNTQHLECAEKFGVPDS